jgi:hypothetical protein
LRATLAYLGRSVSAVRAAPRGADINSGLAMTFSVNLTKPTINP